MRARTAIAWTAHLARLTAAGGFVTVLACVALSACTSSGSPSASVTVLTPSVSGTATVSVPASGTATVSVPASGTASSGSLATSSATVSPSPSPSVSVSVSVSPSPVPSPSPSPSSSPFPTEAPVTGGGGTAGFQDAGLAVLGAAAIVAGLGSIAYRRRVTRRR
jgi:hypothetical protein